MININNLQTTKNTITVIPSDDIYKELGKNSYNDMDLLSELIDNSIAAGTNNGELLNISITLYVDSAGNKVQLVYNDNAKGIAFSKLGEALSPGMKQTVNSLNEHGLGMKQAIASMGDLKYLCTKTEDQTKACYIERLGFGPLNVLEIDWDQPNGLEICVENLNAIVSSSATHITRDIEPYLGARYRRFLHPNAPKMQLLLKIVNIDTNCTLNEWNVKEVHPVYIHPYTRQAEPVICSFPLKGKNWKASLTFGYAPKNESEYRELGLKSPTKFAPYNVALKNQGLDIIFHDRVILFHQLSEVDIVKTKHPSFNFIRGEIELISGFHTAITKNMMIKDEAFNELIEQVRQILNGEAPGPKQQKKDYLTRVCLPEQLPEELLKDRLAAWLGSSPIAGPRKDVQRNHAIKEFDGEISIVADNEAWQLKNGSISAADIAQLFLYMDHQGFSKGYIIGTHLAEGGQAAIEYFAQKHGKNIIFDTVQNYPITQAPTNDERQLYY